MQVQPKWTVSNVLANVRRDAAYAQRYMRSAGGSAGAASEVSQDDLDRACAFISDMDRTTWTAGRFHGPGGSVIAAAFCDGGFGKPLDEIPAQHAAFCMLQDMADGRAAMENMLAQDCAVAAGADKERLDMCLQYQAEVKQAVDAMDVFSSLAGDCVQPSSAGGSYGSKPEMRMNSCGDGTRAAGKQGSSNGLIPQVPHYESFAVIPTLPHVPMMKPKEGTRLHYHGEPIDVTSEHGAAFDYETAALRVGSSPCGPYEIFRNGKCIRYIAM
jgi:hypothetical protein